MSFEYESPIDPPVKGVCLQGHGGGEHKTLHLRTQGSGEKYDPWIGLAVIEDGSGTLQPIESGQPKAVRMHIKASEFQKFIGEANDFVRLARRGEIREECI